MQKYTTDVVTMANFIRCEKLIRMGGIVAEQGKKELIIPLDNFCNSIIKESRAKSTIIMAMERLTFGAIEYFDMVDMSLFDFINFIVTAEYENFPDDTPYKGDDMEGKEAFTYMQGVRRKIVNAGIELKSRDPKVICEHFKWDNDAALVLIRIAFELFDYEKEQVKEN